MNAIKLIPPSRSLRFTFLLSAAAACAFAAPVPRGLHRCSMRQDLSGWRGGDTFDHRKLMSMPSEQREAQIKKWTDSMKDHWTVENGELVNDGEGAYTTTEKDYGDFELLLDYKTVAKADSGIYLRGCPGPIWDYTDPAKFSIGGSKGSGGFWNNSPGASGKDPLVMADKPFGEWNSVRVVMVGSRVSVWLNEKLVVDHANMENYYNLARHRCRPAAPSSCRPTVARFDGGTFSFARLAPRRLIAYCASKGQQSFQPVFNGKDFSGWAGPVNEHEIVDGALRCLPKKGGTIYTENEYDNFIVRFEFELPPGGNNGLAIRYPGSGDTAYVGMCELQVLDEQYEKVTGAKLDPRQYHGSAYGMAAATQGYQRPAGEWNFQEVTVEGSRIKVELNGTIILDTDLAKITSYMGDRPHPGKDRKKGHFGFAGHNDPVAFRNIVIKEI